jgi:hypothetical protein
MNTRHQEVTMAAESETGGGQGDEPLESYIDDLIRALLKDAETGAATAAHAKDPMAAVLIEAAASSLSTPAPQASTLERLLLAEALASSLARALAPVLAEALAPEIMKALGHLGSAGQSRGHAGTATQSGPGQNSSMPGVKTT